jgi:DNA-binding NtrC family response regulator
VDVRVVASTNRDPAEAVRGRLLREDLYYRLNVVPIVLPALRERREDIPLLIDHFLGRAATRFERARPEVAPDALDRLQNHGWPGNVRELENCIDRMVLLARGARLELDDLPPAIRSGRTPAGDPGSGFRLPPEGVDLQRLEGHLIREALHRTRGALGPAARLLSISYKTLQYRIRKHGLDREAFGDGRGTGAPPEAASGGEDG